MQLLIVLLYIVSAFATINGNLQTASNLNGNIDDGNQEYTYYSNIGNLTYNGGTTTPKSQPSIIQHHTNQSTLKSDQPTFQQHQPSSVNQSEHDISVLDAAKLEQQQQIVNSNEYDTPISNQNLFDQQPETIQDFDYINQTVQDPNTNTTTVLCPPYVYYIDKGSVVIEDNGMSNIANDNDVNQILFGRSGERVVNYNDMVNGFNIFEQDDVNGIEMAGKSGQQTNNPPDNDDDIIQICSDDDETEKTSLWNTSDMTDKSDEDLREIREKLALSEELQQLKAKKIDIKRKKEAIEKAAKQRKELRKLSNSYTKQARMIAKQRAKDLRYRKEEDAIADSSNCKDAELVLVSEKEDAQIQEKINFKDLKSKPACKKCEKIQFKEKVKELKLAESNNLGCKKCKKTQLKEKIKVLKSTKLKPTCEEDDGSQMQEQEIVSENVKSKPTCKKCKSTQPQGKVPKSESVRSEILSENNKIKTQPDTVGSKSLCENENIVESNFPSKNKKDYDLEVTYENDKKRNISGSPEPRTSSIIEKNNVKPRSDECPCKTEKKGENLESLKSSALSGGENNDVKLKSKSLLESDSKNESKPFEPENNRVKTETVRSECPCEVKTKSVNKSDCPWGSETKNVKSGTVKSEYININDEGNDVKPKYECPCQNKKQNDGSRSLKSETIFEGEKKENGLEDVDPEYISTNDKKYAKHASVSPKEKETDSKPIIEPGFRCKSCKNKETGSKYIESESVHENGDDSKMQRVEINLKGRNLKLIGKVSNPEIFEKASKPNSVESKSVVEFDVVAIKESNSEKPEYTRIYQDKFQTAVITNTDIPVKPRNRSNADKDKLNKNVYAQDKIPTDSSYRDKDKVVGDKISKVKTHYLTLTEDEYYKLKATISNHIEESLKSIEMIAEPSKHNDDNGSETIAISLGTVEIPIHDLFERIKMDSVLDTETPDRTVGINGDDTSNDSQK